MQGILKFHPIYKQKLWGGRKLASLYHRQIPAGKIGESWEISDYGKDTSVIKNGLWQGKTLREQVHHYKQEILGNHLNHFPLLVKLLDADDWLSVQVHPDYAYAEQFDPSSQGKQESWFIIQTDPNSKIICGFTTTIDKISYRQKIEQNRADEDLQYFTTQPGDAFLIEPGTIHAIGKGNVILEVQESSDSTYRVYDFGRLDRFGNLRPLHIDKALDVLNFSPSPNIKLQPTPLPFSQGERWLLTDNQKFRLEQISTTANFTAQELCQLSLFHIYTLLSGSLQVRSAKQTESISSGETFLIPAQAVQHTEFLPQGPIELIFTQPALPKNES